MTIYYVDTASAGGDGTTEAISGAHAAFKTQTAAHAALTGDQSDNFLLTKRNTPADIYQEQITVGGYGTAGHPYTLGNYGSGESPVIKGYQSIPSWTQAIGGGPDTNLWYDNFDNNSSSQWSTFPAGLTVSNGQAQVVCNATTTSPNVRGDISNNQIYSCYEIWASWDYTVSSITASNGQYVQGGGLWSISASVKPILVGFQNVSGTNYFNYTHHIDGSQTSGNLTAFGEVALDTKYRITIHYKAATTAASADGIVQIWINGTSVYSQTNVQNYLAKQADRFVLGNNYRSGMNITYLVDNVKCGQTGVAPTAAVSSNIYSASLATNPTAVYFDSTTGISKLSTYQLSANYNYLWESGVLYVYATADPNTQYGAVYTDVGGSSINYNSKDYVRVTGMNLINPVTMSGAHGQLDYCINNSASGINVTMSGASNKVYNCNLLNNFYTVISVTGDSNTIKNNNFYTSLVSGPLVVSVDSGVSINPDIDYNNYYRYPSTIQFGINDHLLEQATTGAIDTLIPYNIRLNASVSRSALLWQTTEPTEGNYDWAITDHGITALESNNIEPLVILMGSPQWASGNANPYYVPYNDSDLMTNGDFEDGDFTGWSSTAGNGSVSVTSAKKHAGTYSAIITSGSSFNTFISQTIAVTPATGYSVQYYTLISSAAGYAGERYKIRDLTHSTEITNSSINSGYSAAGSGGNFYNWSSSVFYQKTISFMVPAGCTSIAIDFYGSLESGQNVYIDDVCCYAMTDNTFQSWLADYTNWVTAVATRYNGRIRKYEIWNEAETSYFWLPLPDANQYLQMYVAASNAIHAVDPTAIVAISFGPLKDASNCPSSNTLLQYFYTNSVVPDAVSFHSYTYLATKPPTNRYDYINFSDIAIIRSTMVSAGHSDKNIWVSEFGWHTDDITAANYALYLSTVLNALVNNYSSYVTVACLYDLKDTDGDFGIFASNGSEKLATPNYYGFLKPLFSWKGTVYNFEDWLINSGLDTHSIISDPKFVSAVTPDFHLQSNSPCINAGVSVGLTTDYAGNPVGNPPEIGAYEAGHSVIFNMYGHGLIGVLSHGGGRKLIIPPGKSPVA